MSRFTAFPILVFLGVSLSSCTTLAPKLQTKQETSYGSLAPAERLQALKKLTHWQIQGAFHLRQPEHNLLANYDWAQSGEAFQLRIYSTLNFVSTIIQGNSTQVSLESSSGEKASAATVRALLEKTTGWHLPVDRLVYWVRTLPAPDLAAHKNYDSYGHVSSLRQGDWNIRYERFSHLGPVDLPTLMTIQGPDLMLKIVIKHWQLAA